MAWTYSLDTTVPAGSADPKTLDTIIQNHKKAWQERLNVDLYMPLTGTEVSDTEAGEHRQVTLRVLGADPTNEADKGWVYTKDVSAKAELHWEDEDGNVKQLTSGGDIKGDEGDVILTNEAYLTAVDGAGTGTVDLIKANSSDEVVTGAVTELPDTSRLNSSADPLADEQIVCKGYADGLTTKYVSTWAAAALSGTYTLTHGLGTDEILVQLQFKDTANQFGQGADLIYMISFNRSESNEECASINNITSTQLTIQAGGNRIAIACSPTGNIMYATTGQYRLIAW